VLDVVAHPSPIRQHGPMKTTENNPNSTKKSAAEQRAERLAAELRANLKRRKEKARASELTQQGVPQCADSEQPDGAKNSSE
jgi:hypothetical protein